MIGQHEIRKLYDEIERLNGVIKTLKKNMSIIQIIDAQCSTCRQFHVPGQIYCRKEDLL